MSQCIKYGHVCFNDEDEYERMDVRSVGLPLHGQEARADSGLPTKLVVVLGRQRRSSELGEHS